MYAWAQRQDLEVPDPEANLEEPAPRPAGKRSLTARLQPKGVPGPARIQRAASGAGTPLPAEVARIAQAALGDDFASVRVHVDGQAEALGVRAYAVGEDLHFATGAYAPDTAAGRELLGHELIHVRQQRAGRVAGGNADDTEVVIDPDLEADADRGGERLAGHAAAGFDLEAFLADPTSGIARPPAPATASPASTAPTAPVAQGKDAPATAASASGAGTSTGTTTIPADHAAALARWQQGFARFDRLYRWGLALEVEDDEVEPSRETLFRNSCEWVAAGNTPVVLLAPVEARFQGPGRDTFFDDQLNHPGAQPNQANRSSGWGKSWGVTWREKLFLIDLAHADWTDDALIGTLIHEVQHNADGGPNDAFYPDGAGDLTNYKSEFRAAWIDPLGKDESGRKFGDPTMAAPTGSRVRARHNGRTATQNVVGFGNARQHDIFMNLATLPRSYGYVAKGFVFDAAFRRAVTAYTEPVGGNVLNSIRIQALAEMVAGTTAFAAIRTYAHDVLEAADRDFLLDKPRAADFWSMAKDHLSARYVTELEAAIRAGGNAAGPGDGKYQYTVVAGDTLSLIAGRLLGDPMRYPDICAIPENPQSIRDNPDLIEPGLTLWIPGA